MTQKASKDLNLFLNEDFTNDLETLMMLLCSGGKRRDVDNLATEILGEGHGRAEARLDRILKAWLAIWQEWQGHSNLWHYVST